ncbi:MAG TPA: phosphate ABC transporter substrate-binding protein PstS [Fibrobacteria bacterium]|nr:phosphate ABC transporter substrate-binding protein PstS [Fibrobacteria bacterium]
MKLNAVHFSLLLAFAPIATIANDLNGAGSTFIYPLASKWFSEYNKKTGIRINYQSIGSGAGIRQLLAGTVDFGASDATMSDEDMKKAKGPILHLPATMGAVAIVYNLPNVPAGLKLTPEILAGLFLGEIKKWDDKAISTLNPGMKLPAQDVSIAHRSDGSGTTNIFTEYLTKVSPTWKDKVGKGTAVNWPVGLGAKGNEAVAGLVKQVPGSIGYVELAYAMENKLSYALIKNRAGEYPAPTIEATTAAAAGALENMPADFRASITDMPGKDSYPICGFTWILVFKKYEDAAKAKTLVDFLNWSMDEGQKMGPALRYAPLPASLVAKVKASISTLNENEMGKTGAQASKAE